MRNNNVVDLYDIRQSVMITVTTTNDNGRTLNMPLNSCDFKIYKNSPNVIEFVVKNNDRKPVNILGKTLTIYVIAENGEKLLEKQLKNINTTKGKALLELAPNDTTLWNLGFTKYSIQITNEENKNNLLYVNDLFDAGGFFEVMPCQSIQMISDVVITYDHYTPHRREMSPEPTYYVSSPIKTSSQYRYTNPLTTVEITCENYSGRLFLEGCIHKQIIEGGWDKISFDDKDESILEYHSGLLTFAINNPDYQWLRIVYQPDNENKGTFTTIIKYM